MKKVEKRDLGNGKSALYVTDKGYEVRVGFVENGDYYWGTNADVLGVDKNTVIKEETEKLK